jgi:uncharacterized membrane protein
MNIWCLILKSPKSLNRRRVMKIIPLIFDFCVLFIAISLVQNGYDASTLIAVVSIVSYCCGYVERDLE